MRFVTNIAEDSPFALSEVEGPASGDIACSMSFDFARDEREGGGL
jgi:hypothetical protein